MGGGYDVAPIVSLAAVAAGLGTTPVAFLEEGGAYALGEVLGKVLLRRLTCLL